MPDNDCLPAGKANGSSNRLVADMDNQSKEVEDGIAAALCQSLPLLSTVIRDAAAQTTSPVCPFYCNSSSVARLNTTLTFRSFQRGSPHT